MIKIIIICALAGLGAGLTTGFAGLSAAVFITPMLTVFLGTSFYDAVGIALASDVLASAVSAFTYYRSGNIDIKHGKPLMISVWIASIIGSIIAYIISSNVFGNTALSYWSILCAFSVGIWLIIRADKTPKPITRDYSQKRKLVIILCGIYIGFVCGFQGTGGGMMLLLALTIVMSFEFKKAVGTSVFIMALTALISAISHFAINGMPDTTCLVLCVIFTTIFARLGALIANRMPPARLKLTTGIILVASTIIMFIARVS